MAAEELVYDFAFDALVRGVGTLAPDSVKKAASLGVNFEQKLLPAYPKHTWMALVDVLAAQVSPSAPRPMAHFALGERMTHGFEKTFLGRSMAPAVRTMGVAWILRRSPKNFTMANNFLKVRLEEPDAHRAVVHFSEPSPSLDFLRGCIDAMVRYAGATSVTLDAQQRLDGSASIDVAWT
jgi:uncharacterized protein (TIGR02265 family)